ncbi:MAG TPA: orotate phosphoribosyltransferase-like protein [Candidatus Poseidoniales archaeon]|nr:MAG: orotate phosphoribosyltransferase-like protein [Euryarchaeota archaeon]HIF15688.1 orotate phosphoribosyltransferase-like protein [Candidatus Poseidoniales archaeon]
MLSHIVSIAMTLSVDELRNTVANLKKEGLNSQQIADELSLSQDTVAWLASTGSANDEQPEDIRIGWRTIGVRPVRTEAMASIFADVIIEEINDDVDTIVGISLNGILFAHEIAKFLDIEVSIHRNVEGGDGLGSLSNKYSQVNGKRVVIVDDVLSSGTTMRNTISMMKEMGAEVKLCMVLVNKTTLNEIEEVPLRGIIRAVAV